MKKFRKTGIPVLVVSLLLTSCGNTGDTSLTIPETEEEVDLSAAPEGTNFEDFEYLDFDYEEWEGQFTAVYELLDAPEIDTDAVFSYMDKIKEGYYAAERDYRLSEIYYWCDTSDEFYAEEYAGFCEHYRQIQDSYRKLGFQLINKYQLSDQMSLHFDESECSYFNAYTPTPESLLELYAQAGQLETSYFQLYNKVSYNDATHEYEGLDTYGPEMAEIYSRLIEVRKEIGEYTDAGNYVDYMDNYYSRDYGNADIAAFEELVKSDLSPILNENLESIEAGAEEINPLFEDLTNDDILLLIRNSLDDVSPSMQTAFAFAEENGLILLKDDETAMNVGYTVMMEDYEEPVIYNYISGSYSDVTDTVHEFGHFYANYCNHSGSMDVSETNSQGLEALYACMYPEILGKKTGKTVEQIEVLSLVKGVVTSAQIDEFERRVYQAEDTSPEALCDTYWELGREYGIEKEDYAGSEYYWTMCHHLFDNPLYCISYATSGMVALDIWAQGTGNFSAAVDSYLAVEEADPKTYSDVLTATGYSAPWTEEGMSKVLRKLNKLY